MELNKYNQRHNTAYLMTQSLNVIGTSVYTDIDGRKYQKGRIIQWCKYVTVQDDKQKNGSEILRTTPNCDRGQFSLYTSDIFSFTGCTL